MKSIEELKKILKEKYGVENESELDSMLNIAIFVNKEKENKKAVND